MLNHLAAKKKKTDQVSEILSRAYFASTALFVLAVFAVVIASATGFTAVTLTEWFSRFKSLLFFLFELDKYALLPWLFLIASLDYFSRRKKFLSIHKKYDLVKFPFLTVISSAILLTTLAVYFSAYSMLGTLIAGGVFENFQVLVSTAYVLTVVVLSFFMINLDLDREYIYLTEKLLAQSPNDENLPLRVNIAFRERRVCFRDISESPWDTSDSDFFGGSSSSDSGGGGSASGGGASDDW